MEMNKVKIEQEEKKNALVSGNDLAKLASPGTWLTYIHIAAAMKKMKEMFPDIQGLEDTVLQQTDHFYISCRYFTLMAVSNIDCPPDTVLKAL